jgi:hypothetical protein
VECWEGKRGAKVGAGGASLSVYKRPSSPSSNWVDPTGHNWQAGLTVKLTPRTQPKYCLFIGSALTSNNPGGGHMLNVALHPLDHPVLKGCSRKFAILAAPFSPDSAISYFDYSLDIESRLTVIVHTVY